MAFNAHTRSNSFLLQFSSDVYIIKWMNTAHLQYFCFFRKYSLDSIRSFTHMFVWILFFFPFNFTAIQILTITQSHRATFDCWTCSHNKCRWKKKLGKLPTNKYIKWNRNTKLTIFHAESNHFSIVINGTAWQKLNQIGQRAILVWDCESPWSRLLTKSWQFSFVYIIWKFIVCFIK